MVLAADQLVGDRDADDLDNTGQRAQVERLELLDITDKSDDRAVHTAGDERRAAGVLNRAYDGSELVRRRARRHHHDHAPILPLATSATSRPRHTSSSPPTALQRRSGTYRSRDGTGGGVRSRGVRWWRRRPAGDRARPGT